MADVAAVDGVVRWKSWQDKERGNGRMKYRLRLWAWYGGHRRGQGSGGKRPADRAKAGRALQVKTILVRGISRTGPTVS